MLAHNGFYNNLQGRFKKSFNDTSEDIIDGTLYRQLYNNDGPLSSPYFLVINEVPFKIRMKKENVILAALWYGNEKPAMGTFLKPLQGFWLKDGIKCFSPEGGEFLSKSFLFVATADFKDCRIYHAKFRPGIKKTREKLKTLLSME